MKIISLALHLFLHVYNKYCVLMVLSKCDISIYVLWLFLTVPSVGQQSVHLAFPDHIQNETNEKATHLLIFGFVCCRLPLRWKKVQASMAHLI